MKLNQLLLCIGVCCISLLYSCRAQEPKNDAQPLKTLLQQHQNTAGELYIRIVKADYELAVMKGDLVIKPYPVVFGANPKDDKKQQGDGCTPEGWFKIRSKYPHKHWSKFIWIDYPNEESRKRFAQRKKAGEIPQDASIGGDIGIHGVPQGADELIEQKLNWTLGCISMKNQDVNEIYPYLTDDTKILIVKEL